MLQSCKYSNYAQTQEAKEDKAVIALQILILVRCIGPAYLKIKSLLSFCLDGQRKISNLLPLVPKQLIAHILKALLVHVVTRRQQTRVLFFCRKLHSTPTIVEIKNCCSPVDSNPCRQFRVRRVIIEQRRAAY